MNVLLVLLGILAFTLDSEIQDTSVPQTPPIVEVGRGEAEKPLKIAAGVTAPRVIFDPEAEYSKVAEKARHGGICVLWFVVGTDGKPRDIKVVRSLGLGLDEKAIEAVQKWRFDPARKDGKPVAAQINVEINFHRFGAFDGTENKKVVELLRNAERGSAAAETKVASFYFASENSADQSRGIALLTQAANQGFAKAQFQLGERLYRHSPNDVQDYISSYTWYSLARLGGEKKADKPIKELTPKMSPEQLAEAQARVENWKPAPSK